MVGVPIMLRAATAPKEMINAATALYQRLQLGSGVRIGECCTSAANRTNSAPLCPGGGPPVEFFPNTTGPRKRQRALQHGSEQQQERRADTDKEGRES